MGIKWKSIQNIRWSVELIAEIKEYMKQKKGLEVR
jgi:hypothetical protein